MNGTATVAGASMLAHGIHVTMVLLGLWGLAALLLPQALERRALKRRATTSSYAVDTATSEHARRVAELRSQLGGGALAVRAAPPTEGVATIAPRHPATPALGLPLALVAGAAAAGIHAAVAPAHVAEDPLFAVFFLLTALAQLAWVLAVSFRPTLSLLHLGIALNGALIALWVVTRLVGLPLGLLNQPHPVGGWDVACVVWELVCIAAALRVVRGSAPGSAPGTVPGWFEWHPTTRGAVGAAAFAMVLLTVTGAHS